MALLNLRPAGLVFYGAIVAIVALIASFPLLFPRGIQTSGPELHEGLFVVSDGDWAHASFEPLGLLRENEALRPKGRLRVGHQCLDTTAVRPELERALAQARLDGHGGRGVWLRATATTHFGVTECVEWRHVRRGNQYGSIYRVVALDEVRPLACSALNFVLNNRRCPAPPPKPVPLMLDSASYPPEALGRGAEGRVTIEALIGPKETLLECKPVASSGDAALDHAACGVFAGNIGVYAGKGSTAGLAEGVRRIRAVIRFEIEKPAAKSATSPTGSLQTGR